MDMEPQSDGAANSPRGGAGVTFGEKLRRQGVAAVPRPSAVPPRRRTLGGTTSTGQLGSSRRSAETLPRIPASPEMAEADAQWGDYKSAARWLQTIEWLDGVLPIELARRREVWLAKAGVKH